MEVLLGVGLDVPGQLVAAGELFLAGEEVTLERPLVLVPHDVRLEVRRLPVLPSAARKVAVVFPLSGLARPRVDLSQFWQLAVGALALACSPAPLASPRSSLDCR